MKSNYLLQKSTNLPKYLILSTLNELVMDDSSQNDGQIDRNKEQNNGKDNTASFRTVHSNKAPVGHSTKCHEQIDNIGPEDSTFQISKTSSLLSNILKVNW